MRRFHDRRDIASFTTWMHSTDSLPKPGSGAKELCAEARDRLARVAVS